MRQAEYGKLISVFSEDREERSMSTKKKVTAEILSQRELAPGIYDMWLQTELAASAAAGQFVGVYPRNQAHLLPRPISICEVSKKERTGEGALRIVYRVAGAGTAEFADWQAGEKAALLGILGNGFPIRQVRDKRVVLLGGGIGIPPMLQTFKELLAQGTEAVMVAGYRDHRLFLKEDFEKAGRLVVATEDGSVGIKGNVLTAVEQEQIRAEVLMACGPMPMLRAVREKARETGIAAYISLEERMACGVGACLGCVCKTTKKDAHSHVNHTRICTDGPVFDAQEVDI